MGLQVWYREDIENSLLAVYAATRTTASVLGDSALSQAYCQGFEAALKCVARAFGIATLQYGMFCRGERGSHHLAPKN